ncbi:AP-4 complex accessory subunit RUSC1 [Dendropsophus ebraccatus]|uniref:AP-4 complex accessory subunit RUSC1 n=1 Tax=Dendropsophus ebraccatus TaxID=150705 RepID=UPI003831C727
MLASRKALLSNLNYVHQQHVSLGVLLSMHPDVNESLGNQGTGVKDGCHHNWKDTTMVDPNSNDPSMPCQCCDQHPRQEASLQYSSLEDLDTIICNECLSPDDLPLSPLSLSSPSTDSSSSSDFTLDDSPASMYYKEYSQDGLDTPDQQPDIIPLDAATEGPLSPRDLCLSSNRTLSSNSSNTNNQETNNNNKEEEDPPFIDWGSDSMVDSNSNTLIERSGSSSMDSDTIAEPEVQTNNTGQAESTCAEQCPPEKDAVPGLPLQENTFTPTPKKTITSFHELALRRRRSGGQPPSQPKKDRSDWLIVFSPDTEQPPINELTASAFYHEVQEPQTHPLPTGKEVTTFRELRYRNTLNKQSVQQIKVHEERLTSMEVTTELPYREEVLSASWEPNDFQQLPTTRPEPEEWARTGGHNDQRQGPQRSKTPPNANIPSRRDHAQSGLMDNFPSIRNTYIRQEDSLESMAAPTTTVAWTRGMADGGDRRGREAAECELLMADDEEDSAQQQKKSLLIAVGSSVEKIISHFNTSRNQVQKAQLGDSRLSPVLGYLILNHLCPSLYSLLGDGLKPYQKDVIIGRRRLSPWSLVEASTKTGPELVHLLFHKVSRLPQLRDPQRKFNAFIFGLLNMKQLDVWVLHLHQIYDQLSIFYLPSGFVPLAATLRLELRDELLLSLQPLSALTFHTDLLFEHHHLSLQDLPTPYRVHSPGHVADNWAVPSLQNILDLGGWITQSLSWNTENKAPSPHEEKSLVSLKHKTYEERSERDTSIKAGDCQYAGDTSVYPSGSTQASSSHTVSNEIMTTNTQTPQGPTSSSEVTSNWWGHLSQASQIYMSANRESLSFTALRKLTSWGPMDKEQNQKSASLKERAFPEQRFTEAGTNGGASKTMSKENGQEKGQIETDHNLRLSSNTASTQGSSDGSSSSAGAERVKDLTTMDGSMGQNLDSEEKVNWLGQLFGATLSQNREMELRNSKSRRPSSWLPPNINVWNLIRKQTTPLKPEEEEPRQMDKSRPQRSLRALCDHTASGEAQLSFKKGEVLQLLGTVDEDWIQCRRGSDMGLVPVGYTSLIL